MATRKVNVDVTERTSVCVWVTGRVGVGGFRVTGRVTVKV